MGLLWGVPALPDARTRDARPGAGAIIDKFALSLLPDAYVTLGHCVQNSLTLPCVD